MNREIKFRVYDEDLKKMRYLNSSHDFICFDENGNGYYHNMQTGLGEWFSDLMQYTNLKDKNGIEVYENDIVKYEGEDTSYVVMFDPTGYWCLDGNGARNSEMLYYEDIFKYLEVIGNIYENEYNRKET